MKIIIVGIILLSIIVGVIIIWMIRTTKSDSPQAKKAELKFNLRHDSQITPANIYWRYMTEVTPTAISFEKDVTFINEGFEECKATQMKVIICPDKTWPTVNSVNWDKVPDPPNNEITVQVFNNCREPVIFRVAHRPETKLELIEEQQGVLNIPAGYKGFLYTQRRCTEAGCGICHSDSSFCSHIDLAVSNNQRIRFRISHIQAFTNKYMVGACGKNIGRSGLLSSGEILKNCPSSLSYKIGSETVACVNQCHICKLETALQNCRCNSDLECQFCPVYRSTRMDNKNLKHPLRCINNRCKAHFTETTDCSDIYDGDWGKYSYQDIYCCAEGMSSDICARQNNTIVGKDLKKHITEEVIN